MTGTKLVFLVYCAVLLVGIGLAMFVGLSHR